MAQLRTELCAGLEQAAEIDDSVPTIRMLRSLLFRALVALDPPAGGAADLSPGQRLRVAEHALAEWRAFTAEPRWMSQAGH